MALRQGIHTVGPDSGALHVNTYREGMAQKVDHDLIIDVGQWHANIEVEEGGSPKSIALEADPRSLHVREGQHRVKPLTDKDRTEIRSQHKRPHAGGCHCPILVAGFFRAPPVFGRRFLDMAAGEDTRAAREPS